MSMSISGAGMSWSQPAAMSGASSQMSSEKKMSDLYSKIDTGNAGSITRDQLAQTFQQVNPPVEFKNMGADTIFSKLTNSGSNSVSKQDFVDGMKKLMEQVRNQAASNNVETPAPVGSFARSMESLNALGASGDLRPSGQNVNFRV